MALNPIEAALRYAVLYPSNDFKYQNSSITGSDPLYEVAASLTYYHRPWSRFTFETVFELNTPVAVENGIGSYVLAEQPDQTTVIGANGHVERQFVPELRGMYQLTF